MFSERDYLPGWSHGQKKLFSRERITFRCGSEVSSNKNEQNGVTAVAWELLSMSLTEIQNLHAHNDNVKMFSKYNVMFSMLALNTGQSTAEA